MINMMRKLHKVIEEMLNEIPKDREALRDSLKDILSSLNYAPPELIETLWWSETHGVLLDYIDIPEEEWEYEVFSIFSTKSVEDLKELFNHLDDNE